MIVVPALGHPDGGLFLWLKIELGLHHQAKPMLRVLITLNDKKNAKLHPMVLVDGLACSFSHPKIIVVKRGVPIGLCGKKLDLSLGIGVVFFCTGDLLCK